MKRLLPVVVLALAIPCLAVAQTTTASPGKAAAASRSKVAAVPYGSNPAAGKTFVHDGITLTEASRRCCSASGIPQR